MGFHWPTDPPGKKNHSISWQQHNSHLQGTVKPGSAGLPSSQKPQQQQQQQQSVAPPPFDANYAASQAYGNQVRGNQQSDDNIDLTEYAQNAGIQYNPATGKFGGFDPTNPFSQAALLLKSRNEASAASELSYQRGVAGNKNSYAATGQLYAGSLNNAQGEQNRLVGDRRKSIQFGYDKGYNAIRQGLIDYTKNYGRRKRDRSLIPPPAPA